MADQPLLRDHPGAQFSVSITIDRQAKQFVPTTKFSVLWNNHGAPSTELAGHDLMVPLGNDDGTDAGETMPLPDVLELLSSIAQDATHKAMIIAQAYEIQRPAELEALIALINEPRSPQELRQNLENAITMAAKLAHDAEIFREERE